MMDAIAAQLSPVRRAYLACKSSTELLAFLEESCSDGVPSEEDFVSFVLQNPVSLKHPPHKEYRLKLLKQLISFYEKQSEIQDYLYEEMADVIALDSSLDDNYVSYELMAGDLSSCVTLRETRAFVTQGTTGFKSWPASKILVEVLVKQDLAGKRVLELGAGVGLTGLSVLKLRPDIESYKFTDCHSGVLDVIKENLNLNFDDQRKANIELLDWCVGGSIVADLIVGADIVFDKDIIPSLIKLITGAARKNDDLEIIIASVIRNEETYQTFLECCLESNLQMETIEIDRFDHFEPISEKYEVLKLKRIG